MKHYSCRFVVFDCSVQSYPYQMVLDDSGVFEVLLQHYYVQHIKKTCKCCALIFICQSNVMIWVCLLIFLRKRISFKILMLSSHIWPCNSRHCCVFKTFQMMLFLKFVNFRIKFFICFALDVLIFFMFINLYVRSSESQHQFIIW